MPDEVRKETPVYDLSRLSARLEMQYSEKKGKNFLTVKVDLDGLPLESCYLSDAAQTAMKIAGILPR